MKAKLILTAMAMPVLFAACTSDELVPMEEMQQVQRPLLSENFKLTTEIEAKGDAETRYAVSENEKGSLNFAWTDGDEYAAVLIDEAQKGDAAGWNVIPTSGTINKFTYVASSNEWTYKENTGIGHYLFSYKYNPKDVEKRLAVSYSLETVQKITKNDLNASIKEYNKAVGAALLRGESAQVQLKNLFAYPKFRIQFDNGLPVSKIYKVVLENPAGFQVAGGYNHENIWNNLFNPEVHKELVGEDKTFADMDEFWADKQTADFVLAGPSSPYADIKTSNYIVAEFQEVDGAEVDPVKNTNNKSIDVRFMIPGGLMNNLYSVDDPATTEKETLNMYIYTNSGVYVINDVYENIEFGRATTPEQMNRIFARNTSYTLKLAKLLANDKTTDAFNIVTSVDDWNDLVFRYGKLNETLNIKAIGEDFTLKGKVDMPTKAIFNVETELNIGGDVTLSNVTAGTVNVATGATLTPGEKFTATTINNYGAVNFEKRTKAYMQDGEINNYGTVTVVEGADVTFTLNNKVDADDEDIKGKFTNNGTATVVLNTEETTTTTNAAGATINLIDNGVNAGDFTNNGTVIVVEESKDDAKCFTNEGKFTNNKGATVKLDNWYGEFVNASGAEAYVMDGSNFTISKNDGEIVLEKATQTTGYTPLGTVVYYAGNETVKKSANKYLDKLYVNGNVILDNNKYTLATGEDATNYSSALSEIIVKEEGSLTINTTDVVSNVIVEKEAALSLTSTVGTISTLTLEEKAEAHVSKGSKITVTYFDFETNAKFYVGGKITTNERAEDWEKDVNYFYTTKDGDIKFNGESSGDAAIRTAKENYEAAILPVIKEFWKSQSSHAKDTKGYGNWILYTDDTKTDGDQRFDIAATIAGSESMYMDGKATDAAKEAYKNVVEKYNAWQMLLGDGTYVNKTFAEIAALTAVKKAFRDRNETYVDGVNDEAVAAVKTAVDAKTLTDAWLLGRTYVYVNDFADYADMWTAYHGYLIHADVIGKLWAVDDDATADVDENGDADLNNFRLYKYAIQFAFSSTKLATPSEPSVALPAGSYYNAPVTGNVYKAIKAWIDNAEFRANDATTTEWVKESVGSIFYNYSKPYTESNALENIQNWYIKASNITKQELTCIRANNAAKQNAEFVYEMTDEDYPNALLLKLIDVIEEK